MNKIFSVIWLIFGLGATTILTGGGRELPDIFSINTSSLSLDTIPQTKLFEAEKKNPFDLDDPKSVDKTIPKPDNTKSLKK